MKDTKIIEFFKKLSKEELKEFEKFTASPYFSRGRDLLPMLKILKQFYPEFENEKLSDEFVFRKLFPEKKFGDEKSYSLLKTYTSELYKLGKEFLTHLEFNNDNNRKNYYLLNQLRKKKLYKEFEKEYKNSIEIQEGAETGAPEDFLDKYFLNLAFVEFSVDNGRYKDAFNSIFLMADYLAFAALIRGFRLTEIKIVAKNLAGMKPGFIPSEFMIESLDEEKFIEGIKKHDTKYYPLIEISYIIHKMTKEPDKREFYFDLKKSFFEHLNLLGQSEKYMLFGILGSYCIGKIEENDRSEFRKELFGIYSSCIELGVYKWRKEDDFQMGLFRNIVVTASSDGETEWLENFIQKYSGELNVNYRENMINYSLANLYFAKGEFEKALDYLGRVKYDMSLFKTDLKNIYFRIYYELNYTEQCFSVLDSMKHYAATSKDLTEFFKKRINNFVRYATELLKNKSNFNNKNIDMLYHKVENEKHIDSRSWLLSKIKNLK